MTQGAARPRRPTMVDVAREAGVGLKTVSRVVNGEEGVRPALARRVTKAIAALGYEPDHRAQILRRRSGATATIGFVLDDVANPFFSAIYRGLEDVVWDAGYAVIAGSSDGATARCERILRTLITRRVDGLVVVPSGDDHRLTAEAALGTPVVLVDREASDLRDVDLVRSEHRGGARIATEHLLRHGHRRIAFLGDAAAIFSASERHAGFREAMHGFGLEPDERWTIFGLGDPDLAARAVRKLLSDADDRPTALFTAQNFITIGAVRILHELGLHHEIALVGFDDIELSSAVEPGVTVMPQRPTELGRIAATMLLERLGGYAGAPRRTLLEGELIVRGSGEITAPR